MVTSTASGAAGLLVPPLPPSVPKRASAGRRFVGRTVLRLMGWRSAGALPDIPKFVVIVAPHTSNWDFVVGFAVYLAVEIDARWLGKHTLFRWPVGRLLRYFGGIPIERSHARNVVDLHVEEFQRRDRFVIAIAPEGTRTRTREWKSGFWRIASGAGVPVVPIALDYATRTVHFLQPLPPSGDYAADLTRLRSLFDARMARYPENY